MRKTGNLLQGIRDWFFNISDNPTSKEYSGYTPEYQIKEAFKKYALQICINKIGNALSMCDFVTYEKKNGKSEEVIGRLWYQLNVSPNVNQSASEFWQKLVHQAVYDKNGALVVQVSESLVIADSYNIKEFAILPNIYSEVKVGDFQFEKAFNETEIMRIKFSNDKINSIISGVYEEYGNLISGAIRNYNRGNSKKLWIKLGTMFNQLETKTIENEDGTTTTEADLILDDLFKNRLKNHFSDKDSATPIENGLEIVEANKNEVKPKDVTTRDITDVFDDIVNYVADAFGIPRGLLKGDVADIEAMTDNFISFCIKPFANLIEDGLNRKFYTEEQVIQGSKVKVKTARIKTQDPIKIASSAEALYRIGAINTEYVRWLINEEPINEAWARDYALTKNYERNNDKKEVTG